MRKKVLLLDSSFAVKPIYDALKRKYDVFTVGNDNNAYFFLNAPERHYHVDYSDLSKLKTLLTLNDFDEVVPGCTDVSISTFSAIKDNFKSITIDTVTKKRFSDFCKQCGVAAPEILTEPESGDLPIIVKPDDSFSGKGVSIVSTLATLETAKKHASHHSRTNNYIFQKYLDGPLKSFSAFRQGNDILIVNVHEENREGTFGVAKSFCFEPEPQLRKKLNEIAEKFLNNSVKKLDFIHVQYILHNYNPYPIELMLRCPGDLYPELVRLSTGVDYGSLYCSAYLNDPLTSYALGRHNASVVRKTLFAKSRDEAISQLHLYSGSRIFFTVNLNEAFDYQEPIRFAVVFMFGDQEVYV